MQVLSLRDFEYDKTMRLLRIASECFAGTFPVEFDIVSHHTGQSVHFVVDAEASARNDGWDGEQCEYISTVPMQNIDKVVVYHAY